MMLFGGFGFLMTFLRRHGFTAVALTMLITVVVTEWAILFKGVLHIDSDFNFGITFERRAALLYSEVQIYLYKRLRELSLKARSQRGEIHTTS